MCDGLMQCEQAVRPGQSQLVTGQTLRATPTAGCGEERFRMGRGVQEGACRGPTQRHTARQLAANRQEWEAAHT